MDNKLLLIVAAVAVLLIAGVAVFAMGGDDDDTSGIEKANELGTVYGNADGDYRIDAEDVKLIKQLAKEKDEAVIADNLEKFPMADVNHDGKIDGADADLTQMIVDGKAVTVDVLDDTKEVKTVPFPMNNLLVTGGTNMRVAIAVLQMEDKMLANATNKYIGPVMDKTLYEYRESKKIVSVTTEATSDDLANLSKLDLKGAIFEEEGMGKYGEGAAIKFLQDKGLSPLNFTMDNYQKARTAISTMGILIGSEENAQSYIEYMDGVVKTIDDKLGNEKGTKTVLSIVMSNSVSGTKSDYYAMSILAGGNNIADWPDKTKKYNPQKTGDYWLLDPKYNPDFLIHFKSMVYGTDPSQKDIDNYRGYFKDTKAYENGNYYLLNGTIPLPARLAYMAEIMYPDLIGEGYGDEIFQQYFDNYSSVKDWKVTEHKSVWSVSDF